MDIIDQIITYIARTNLFNFVIFAGIIIFLICRLKVGEKIGSAVNDVAETINESEAAKTESEEKLSTVETSMEHLSDEIDAIIEQSEKNAKLVGEKIVSDTQKTIDSIKENTQKTIENNKVALKNDIIRRASLASVEVAKAHIIEELKRNPDLHDRLIDESINAIEGTEA